MPSPLRPPTHATSHKRYREARRPAHPPPTCGKCRRPRPRGSPSDYHVSRRGQVLGAFPLDAIRGKRASGELTGAEFVWRADLPNWLPIDQVLGPPPLRPLGKKESSRSTAWWIGAAVAAFLVIVGGGAYAAYWGYREVKKVVAQAQHDVLVGRDAEPDGMELAGPIAPGPDARSRETRWPVEREFRERHYVEGYRRDGLRVPANDALVLQYLETWLTVGFGYPTVEEERRIEELGARLLADPEFRDPIVLSILATNGAAADRDEKRRLLERAVAGMPDSRHRPYPWFCTVVSYAATLPKNTADRLAELDATALRLLEQAVKEGGLPAGDQEILADNLVYGWAESFFSRQGPDVRKIFEEAGADWRWLSLVLAGEDHINLAWKARGGGYANTVNEQAWRGFAEELATARERLEAAWSLDPARPLAPARLIPVAMGESRPDEMRVWFDRVIAAECDHRPGWNALRWGLRPRWFGSHEALLALGDAGLATGRYDTELPRQFWMAVDEVADDEDLPPGETLYARKDIWPRLSQMFEGYVAADLAAPLRDRWRTDYACAAYSVKKYQVARVQLEALGWEPMPSRLLVRGRRLPHLANEVAARTGAHAAQVAEAEALLTAGQAVRAREIYREILSGSPDARTRAWAEARQTP